MPPGPRLAVRRPESKVVTAMRDQVRDRLERARRFHATGLEDYAAGRFLKAAGSFQLACEFDPKNETYRKLHEDAQVKAQAAHLEQLLGLAKKADENMQEAACIHYLKQAIPLEPSDGAVYFRVARWMRDKDNDPRGALQLLRKAVERKPDKLEYRMALADLYATLKMELNAKREYQAILDRDTKHEGAKKAMAALKV